MKSPVLQPLRVPLRGRHLIEASAGTGKTYTIAALYLRLVLGHGGKNGFGRPLSPPEILVVTFTNAATEELRERIRGRLTEAAAFFRGQGEGDDILCSLRDECHGDEWPGQARLLSQAAQWMDESAIYTIHGWCQRMLRQHAFDSGSLFDLELEANERDLLEEAACDYWRSQFYPRTQAELAEMLSLLPCKTPQELLDLTLPLIGVIEKPAPSPFSLLAQRRQTIDRARKPWRDDWETAAGQIREAREDKRLNGNKYRAASLEDWLTRMRDWIFENGPLPEEKILEKFSGRGLASGTSKKRHTPRHEAYDALDRLRDQLAGLDIAAALVHHAAEDISRRVGREKERQARMGFDDLLTRMGGALKGPGGASLAQVLSRQFPVTLIDEFQDTDPIQYDIFHTVYRDAPESTGLFMIGDPKQAIYAFRGADIHTYLRARRNTAGHRHTLATNYRSTRDMVAAVNQLFAAAGPYPKGPFLFSDEIPFEPAAARGRDEELVVSGRPHCAMTLWQLTQEGPLSQHGPAGYLSRMAEATATEIVRLLHLAQEIPPGAGFKAPDGAVTALRPADIAILVRDGTEARLMRRCLDRRSLRSIYLSDRDSVFATVEARDLLCILQACAEPDRGRLLRAALATATLALPLDRLDRFCREEVAWEAEVERFRELRQIWRYRGVLPMLRSFLQAFEVPARLLAGPGGERSLTNLVHLAEILQAAAARLDGEPALIRWLAERIAEPGSASEEAILRLESDEELIRVVTIHKSKGLEYPLVFLPFICRFRAVTRRNTPVAQYHDPEGRLRRVPDPSDEDLERSDRERLAEDLRMLYVAVTRARFACWLGIAVLGNITVKRGEESHLHQSALGYLLGAGDPIPTGTLTGHLLRCIDGCPAMALSPPPDPDPAPYRSGSDSPQREAARAFSGQVPYQWSLTSYTGILEGSERVASGPPETARAGPGPRSIHRFPRGPRPGTFLHGLLEWAAGEGFSRVAPDRGLLQEKIEVASSWHGWQDWAGVLTDWLQQLLSTPLSLPLDMGPMPLSQLGKESCQAELEFLFSAHQVSVKDLDMAIRGTILPDAPRPILDGAQVNGMIKGFIDLVFCHAGRYYIMDYKSNYLGEGPEAYRPQALGAAMLDHRYDLQYVLYTLALHRLLKARLPQYDYGRHMGGVLYLFLRGVDERGRGIYGDRPPRALIEQLDAAFAGKERPDAT